MKSLLISIFLILSAAAHAQVLTTAEYVDIGRYVGKWYAIKSLPQSFTKSCVAQTADYEIINESAISLVNTCIKRKGTTSINGRAKVANKQTNAELNVKFNTWWNRLLPFIQGDYNIIKIDPNYEYVMVGSRNRKSLWIMSRRPEMPDDVLKEYEEMAKKEGFKVEKLVLSEF
jgi:apolipoprotein D and lipocalin family protein